MRHLILFGLLTALPLTAHAQTCNLFIKADVPDSRYQTTANGIALDKKTGLIWKRCAEGQIWNVDSCTGLSARYTWSEALQRAENTLFAGKNDWRLPNQKELHSLVESRCVDPALNSTVFPNTPSEVFWSSSPVNYLDGGFTSWIVYFGSGYDSRVSRGASNAVRLVRSGQ